MFSFNSLLVEANNTSKLVLICLCVFLKFFVSLGAPDNLTSPGHAPLTRQFLIKKTWVIITNKVSIYKVL